MDQTGVPRQIARRECPLLLLVSLLVVMPAAAATRRALLIGIDDYTAAAGTGGIAAAGAEREYTDLDGAVADAKGLRDMLIGRFCFDEGNVRLLTNGEATRDGILAAIRTHLVEPAQKDDEVVFFFAGHGSQVVNSLSDEPDKLDETLVPADAARGVRDIRDKELRRYFNRILDRGARLTVVLDSCHSGSGWKGLPVGGKVRAVAPDLRDVADGCVAGRRPENRGALLLAAAQDFQRASESCDENGQVHGAFSLALLRALRTAGVGESAERVFLRARALMRAGEVLQDPVLAGDPTRLAEPPFGGRRDHVDGATVVAVGKVEPEGKLVLQGGWVHGLSVDSELRQLPSAESRDGWTPLRAQVTKVGELMRSEARILGVDPAEIAGRVKVGDLFALDRWVVPVEVSLELWIPEADLDAKGLLRMATEIAAEVADAGIRWVDDPVATSPSHVMSWQDGRWQLLGPDGRITELGARPAAQAVMKVLAGARGEVAFFLHLPAPSALVRDLKLGEGTANDAVARTSGPQRAHYALVGRYLRGEVAYAWVRPNVTEEDRARSPLPLRTDWYSDVAVPAAPDLAACLRDSALRIAKIRAWLTLASPGPGYFPYRLALWRTGEEELRRDGKLRDNESYGVALRAGGDPFLDRFERRYVYAFVIDSFGNSTLLFPDDSQGSVENRFPVKSAAGDPYPREIRLDSQELFGIREPFGIDTYFLLTSVEPIPNPWVLEHGGVRHRGPPGTTALESLLADRGSTSRGVPRVTPMGWSLERLQFESVAVTTPE